MPETNPKKILKWLKTMPSLNELRAEFPQEWIAVERNMLAAYQRSKGDKAGEAKANPKPATRPARGKAKGRKALDPALSHYIQKRMAQLAIKDYGLISASGVKKGVVRFNYVNGFIIKSLLFAEGLARKPASLAWFRLLWPLVWQKKRLMFLAESEGIYCFYSRELIAALAGMIGARPCLEIAAGDGTLSRFLSERGVSITASDDRSWGQAVKFPDSVVKRDAREALKVLAPEVVICSWPPANNDFERHVFKTRSVQTYIVIGSRHEFATGNWADYRRQTAFTFDEDKALSPMVLPPELGCAVYVFQRKP